MRIERLQNFFSTEIPAKAYYKCIVITRIRSTLNLQLKQKKEKMKLLGRNMIRIVKIATNIQKSISTQIKW